jgi:biotin-(acetyl-CoA carboxylase) ligase
VTVTIGKEQFTGVAKEIGADGSLVLHTDSGRKHIRSADILSST